MLNESQIKYKKVTHRTQSPEDTLRNIEKIIKEVKEN